MELKNTIRNMFLNSLISDLDNLVDKLDDVDFKALNFEAGTVENIKLLLTVLEKEKEYFKGLRV